MSNRRLEDIVTVTLSCDDGVRYPTALHWLAADHYQLFEGRTYSVSPKGLKDLVASNEAAILSSRAIVEAMAMAQAVRKATNELGARESKLGGAGGPPGA